MTYVLGKVDPSRGPGYQLAKDFGAQLLENCKEVVGTAPLYKDGKCNKLFQDKDASDPIR